MSPQLKPLLLPQLVEERKKFEVHQYAPDTDNSFVYCTNTNNSSCSDLTTPITPTFSTKGHFRFSSSTSSLDLPPQLTESPSPPAPSHSAFHTGKQPLPDVQEDPLERDGDDTIRTNNLGLYSCLCDGPCDHGSGANDLFTGDIIGDYDIDYDIGFMSDGDVSTDTQASRRKRLGSDSPFTSLTSRFGSRFSNINRWTSTRKANLMSSPTTEISFENVLSRAPSSRSSSISAPRRHMSDRYHEPTMPPTPEMSYHGSSDSVHRSCNINIDNINHRELERERSLATTPLLPPLLNTPLAKPPVEESPLQSPTIAPSSVVTEIHSPLSPSDVPLPRPSLSTQPSTSSLKQIGATVSDLPIPLPPFMPERDEWSDELGHANFTISPVPYEPNTTNSETLGKFREDWDTARVNYTRHLVRTGENYGQTSKIYALTEAKWAQTEQRWNAIHDDLRKQTGDAPPPLSNGTRSRSRGRTRGRSGSVGATVFGRPSNDDDFASTQWRRLEENFASTVPQMLEALDAEGKFPNRGDEDIVGPMHRDVAMSRTQSEEARGGKFWKNLAGKVGIRK